VHHRLPVGAALTTAFYAAPQQPDDARRLFEAGYRSIGFDGEPTLPLRPNRSIGSSLVLAKEWGLAELEQRLTAAIDASYEPTWDTERGEFTWGMGLDEPHPRGQLNAFLAAGEAGASGAWGRLSAEPLARCPQLVGVDVDELVLSQAEWIDGNLRVGLSPRQVDPSRSTGFRLIGAEPRNWEVHGLDGVRLDLTTTGLDISVPMVDATFDLIRSSY